VAFGPGDTAPYIDEQRRIWHQDLVEGPAPAQFAESFEALLQRLSNGKRG
jgi:hypothetical protein